MTQDHGRLAGLDSLRGFAVLLVVLFHSGLLPFGWAGVDLFFGLSGFLITRILLRSRTDAQSFRQLAGPFYVRRALRILPLAWSAIAIAALLTRTWKGPLLYATYVANLAWVDTRFPPAELAHFWSLSVEEQFYFVWPLVVWTLNRRLLRWACVAIIAIEFGARTWLSHIHAPLNILVFSTMVSSIPLVVGCWLATLDRLPRRAVGLLVLSSLAFVATPWLQQTIEGWRYVLAPIPIAVAIGAALVSVRGDWKPLASLGTISYGVYVIHGLLTPWAQGAIVHPTTRAIMLLGLSIA